jgi:hypothetical protein
MLGEQGVAEFIHRMQEHVNAATTARIQAVIGNLPSGPVPIEIVLQFISSAYVGIIQWWLEQGQSYSPEDMANLIVSLYRISPFKAMGLQVDDDEIFRQE